MTEFGELPNDIWIEELAKLSPRNIQFGLEQCVRSGANFAPRLPQFLAFCVIPEIEDVKKQERETYAMLSAPKRRASKETLNAAKATISQIFGEPKEPTLNAEDTAKKQAEMIEAAERLLQRKHE